MTSKSAARIVVEIGQSIKPIISIGARSSGDLVVRIKSAQEFRVSDLDSFAALRRIPIGSLIKEQRYSIHLSKESNSGVDTLKQTFRTDGGDLSSVQYTKAIRGGGFSHLYSRRYPDMRHEYHKNAPADNRNIVLCKMDPKIFTLFTSVFVGSTNSALSVLQDDYNHISMDFGPIRLTVLWSFLPIPSHRSGMLSHGMTLDPESQSKIDPCEFDDRVRGWSDDEVDSFFNYIRNASFEEMIGCVRGEAGALIDQYPHQYIGYFKEGGAITREFIERFQAANVIRDLIRVGSEDIP